MKLNALTYMVVLLTYLVLDFIWLGLVSQQSYQESIGHLMRDEVPKWPWVTFYLIYSFVLVRLVVVRPYINNGLLPVFINGCLFGCAAYGAFNLTNYAILESWPLFITLKDWAWGTLVSGLISVSGAYFYRKFSVDLTQSKKV
jgi:uncharacterized membrane protein